MQPQSVVMASPVGEIEERDNTAEQLERLLQEDFGVLARLPPAEAARMLALDEPFQNGAIASRFRLLALEAPEGERHRELSLELRALLEGTRKGGVRERLRGATDSASTAFYNALRAFYGVATEKELLDRARSDRTKTENPPAQLEEIFKKLADEVARIRALLAVHLTLIDYSSMVLYALAGFHRRNPGSVELDALLRHIKQKNTLVFAAAHLKQHNLSLLKALNTRDEQDMGLLVRCGSSLYGDLRGLSTLQIGEMIVQDLQAGRIRPDRQVSAAVMAMSDVIDALENFDLGGDESTGDANDTIELVESDLGDVPEAETLDGDASW